MIYLVLQIILFFIFNSVFIVTILMLMKNTNDVISICMIAISGIFLLSLGFSVIPYSAHGNTTVNLHWFNISLFILALSTLFSELTSPKIGFKFLLPDLLILLLAGSAYFSYNHPLNASPEKLRSEERRVGKEGTYWCRSRWFLYM